MRCERYQMPEQRVYQKKEEKQKKKEQVYDVSSILGSASPETAQPSKEAGLWLNLLVILVCIFLSHPCPRVSPLAMSDQAHGLARFPANAQTEEPTSSGSSLAPTGSTGIGCRRRQCRRVYRQACARVGASSRGRALLPMDTACFNNATNQH